MPSLKSPIFPFNGSYILKNEKNNIMVTRKLPNSVKKEEKLIHANIFGPVSVSQNFHLNPNGFIRAADYESVFLTKNASPKSHVRHLRICKNVNNFETSYLSIKQMAYRFPLKILKKNIKQSHFHVAPAHKNKQSSYNNWSNSALPHASSINCLPAANSIPNLCRAGNTSCIPINSCLSNSHIASDIAANALRIATVPRFTVFPAASGGPKVNLCNIDVLFMYITHFLYQAVHKHYKGSISAMPLDLKLFYAFEHDDLSTFNHILPYNYLALQQSQLTIRFEHYFDRLVDCSQHFYSLQNHTSVGMSNNAYINHIFFGDVWVQNHSRNVLAAVSYLKNRFHNSFLREYPNVKYSYSSLVEPLHVDSNLFQAYYTFTPELDSSLFFKENALLLPELFEPKPIFSIINPISLYLLGGYLKLRNNPSSNPENLLNKIYMIYKHIKTQSLFNNNQHTYLKRFHLLYTMNLKLFKPKECKVVNQMPSITTLDNYFRISPEMSTIDEYFSWRHKLIYRFLNKLYINVNLLEEIPGKPGNTLFIWDWDDTLIPTFSLTNHWDNSIVLNIPKSTANLIKNLEKKLINSLEMTLCYGTIVIITNASYTWFFESAMKLTPTLWNFIKRKSIEILSARDICESFSKEYGDWKRELILYYIRTTYDVLFVSPESITSAFQKLRCINSSLFPNMTKEEKKIFYETSNSVKVSRFCRLISKRLQIHLRIFVMLGLIVKEDSDTYLLSKRTNSENPLEHLSFLNEISTLCPVCQSNYTKVCDLSSKQDTDRNFHVYCNQYQQSVQHYMKSIKLKPNRIASDVSIMMSKESRLFLPPSKIPNLPSYLMTNTYNLLRNTHILPKLHPYSKLFSSFKLINVPCTVVSIGDGESERASIMNAICDYSDIQQNLWQSLIILRNLVLDLFNAFFSHEFKEVLRPSNSFQQHEFLKAPFIDWRFISIKLENKPTIKELYKTHHFFQQVLSLILRVNDNVDASIVSNTVYYRKQKN